MRIYLDHNATTPLREAVAEAMAAALRAPFGNPSSVHAEGAAARAALERARGQVAALFGASPGEVVFTAGASEANNLALQGFLRGPAARGRHVVTSAVEHPSVAEPLAALEREGWRVTRVPVDADGLLDPARLEAALGPETALVSLLWANNETGVVQPLERLLPPLVRRGLAVHVDATQAAGKLPIDLRRLPVHLLSASAHKLNGPKGVGCLVVRAGLGLEPWVRGGPQERLRRGGTENVPGVVGFGLACELAAADLAPRSAALTDLRDRLWEGIASKIPRVRRNGAPHALLPNTLNVEFEAADGEALLQALDLEGIAVSAGAACASGSLEPSHVLLAMGRSPSEARGALRFSLGLGVDEGQVDTLLGLLPRLVARAREATAR